MRRRRGSAFSRFKDKARAFVERQKNPAAPIKNLRAINDHIQKYFGEKFFVLHGKKSAVVHIDVNVVLPSATRPYYTLLTSGMSDRTMRVPRGVAGSSLAELCLCLPKEWPISQEDMKWATPEYFWPIAALKEIARYPHLRQTWVSLGHTFGSIEHPEPLDPESRFVGLILLRPLTFPKGAEQATAEDGREIQYLAIIPLMRGELAFKLDADADALSKRLMAAGVTEVLNPGRQSVVSD